MSITETKKIINMLLYYVTSFSNCKRTKTIALIVRRGKVISAGYNYSDECENNKCKRSSFPDGDRYDLCPAVHAETMAISNASKFGIRVEGADLFLYSRKAKSGKTVARGPCMQCWSIIKQAGIDEVYVIISTKGGEITYEKPRHG